jgi:predicted metallo-beta-lactamase superfamily hydrolase
VQVAIGEQVRHRITTRLEDTTDIVMSHLHGDHVSVPDANPFQLKAQQVACLCQTTRLWAKGPQGLSTSMVRWRTCLVRALGRELPSAEGQSHGPPCFSPAVPHDRRHTHPGIVMMTRIEDGETVFVHASDIQLPDRRAVSLILDWEPDIALVGGLPLYLSRLSWEQRAVAWENAKPLASHVNALICDDHLLRCEERLVWLDRLSSETHRRVICAADFMGAPRCLLEAWREQLYVKMPVPSGWHKAYAWGNADAQP